MDERSPPVAVPVESLGLIGRAIADYVGPPETRLYTPVFRIAARRIGI